MVHEQLSQDGTRKWVISVGNNDLASSVTHTVTSRPQLNEDLGDANIIKLHL